MLDKLVDNIREESQLRYSEGKLNKFCSGATYVGMHDRMVLQMNPSNSSVPAIVKRRVCNVTREVNELIQRSWSPLIKFMQTEDHDGYGTPMKPVRCYQGKLEATATMMQWAVTSAIVGCKELCQAMDKKNLPFHHNNWAGHMLAHVHGAYMKHEDSRTPKGTLFKPKRRSKFILAKMEDCLPVHMRNYTGTSASHPDLFYQFSLGYWRKLFPMNDYLSISIHQTVGTAVTDIDDSSKIDVIIVVGSDKPNEDCCEDLGAKPGEIIVGGEKYDARVLLCINADASEDGNSRRSKFVADRYTRHGEKGFSNWWIQKRRVGSPQLMTKYIPDPRHAHFNFPQMADNCLFYATVYVKCRTHRAEHSSWIFTFHSVGRHMHIAPAPMIPSLSSCRAESRRRGSV